MHTWRWRNWNGLPYLTCSLLEPWAHGFFTQQFWPRSPEELVEVLQPTASVYRVKQVHGNTVLSTETLTPQVRQEALEEDAPPKPEADGLMSAGSQEAIWVCSADCSPVLIGDIQTGQVAALHSGWRGTAANIVAVAISDMVKQGSQLEQLRVAIGPAISGPVYQVNTEVALKTCASLVDLDNSEDILKTLQDFPNSPILPDSEPGKSRLDVRRTIELQLEQLGITSEQVAISPHCTYQDPENFFSYRRDGLKKVQWSGIVAR
ncbi:peptidoglycan editing factor PgeF [Laspinema sp. A4]|uniref:peptidoglycan editing factor PgeF n=1 Tax=Laspinema sp. D2d TaxID=2953686 RepID=UPI0021BB4221|nr:peptidoglycan editing factor PgeF [Laspinema sp. D2d]MCT7983055.1 peptidoglycan editing factor PgeF [Laspinema sp. D2d]